MARGASDPPREGPWLALLRLAGRLLLRLPRAAAPVFVVAWMGVIWWLSSQSVPPGPRIPLWGFLSNLLHAPLFGLLALLVLLGVRRRGGASGWPRSGPLERAIVLAVVLGYGVVDELHQSSTPGRDPSFEDVLTDGVAAVAVLWIVAYVGSERARDGGLGARLGISALACAAAAWLATLSSI